LIKTKHAAGFPALKNRGYTLCAATFAIG